MTERLTLRGVIAANRKALAEGTLLAMQQESSTVACLYINEDGYRCAVGVALPDDVLEGLRWTLANAHDAFSVPLIFDLLPKGSAGEDERIADLQTVHDNWAHRYRVGPTLTFVHKTHPLAYWLLPISTGPERDKNFTAEHYARVLDALEAWADANLRAAT